MSLFETDENFDEILAKGKRIDKGIQHLEKKLSNVKNLGVSFAPEETKNTALNVLKEYEEEVAAMKENCDHCLEEEEKLLKESVEANEGIVNFVKNMKNELDKIEENLKSMGQYQPYQEEPIDVEDKVSQHDLGSPILDGVTHNDSDIGKSVDVLESNNTSPSHLMLSPDYSIKHGQESRQKMTNGKSFDTGSLCSESNGGFNFNLSASTSLSTPLGITRNFSKYSEKSIDSLDACHTPMRSSRKPVSYIDDTCRTPIDPGISLASMKLLGKSNIKTKVYKTGLTVCNNKNE